MRVLVLNAGSSTLKASLVDTDSGDATDAAVEWPPGDDASTAGRVVADLLDRLPFAAHAVGYRAVHGGSAYREPARVDDQLLATVEELDALAPLHNRRAALVMRAGRSTLPDLAHVACFDTAFHATLPKVAFHYPLPPEWIDRWGIRRFGFHGLSVEWAAGRTAELLATPAAQLRMVVAHLGSGCSVTAVDAGRSVDTTMGFTPYEGPMMGTRSGSVDPGILLHLLREGVEAQELADGLSHRSGLLGVAGVAGAREVEQRADSGDRRAALALDMFVRSTAAAIAAMATSLPALDALTFTGGIGEHSPAIRRRVLARLSTLGAPVTDRATDGDAVIAEGPPAVLVVRAREDLVIARAVARLSG